MENWVGGGVVLLSLSVFANIILSWALDRIRQYLKTGYNTPYTGHCTCTVCVHKLCSYVWLHNTIYTTSGNEARLKVLEDTDILAIGLYAKVHMFVALPTHWWLSLQDGCTPLMIASDRGQPSVVKVLLQAGANINTTSQVRYITVHHWEFSTVKLG